MDEDLRQLRIDLAAALRWAARLGMQEGVDNHFSLAVPDRDGAVRGDRFLINPCGRFWSEITASSLALCDSAGDVLEGADGVEDTAYFIHSRIHLGAPHAVAVLHTHMPYTTALTLLEDGRLEMCEQNALSFQGASPTTVTTRASPSTAQRGTGSPRGSATAASCSWPATGSSSPARPSARR